ncbi:MAG: phosphatase PAP2 family protein [Deltaproteobacteria bacterium]|nr:phosphatase PAP2 family protein [Deltaproteobacteria bacterium]
MKIFLKRYLLACLLIATLGLHATPAMAAKEHGPDIWAADILTGVVPLTGLAVAYFTNDTEGQKQWLRNIVINQVITTGMRVGFNETSLGERPDGNEYGFPSGHVACAMAGATFLGQRYGWKWGAPAYLASAYVAYVRVDNDKHHWRDVIAAGALAYGVSLLTVTPKNATFLAPVIGPGFIGLRWQRSF